MRYLALCAVKIWMLSKFIGQGIKTKPDFVQLFIILGEHDEADLVAFH